MKKSRFSEEQIRQNLNMSINYLVSLLKKGWNNIQALLRQKCLLRLFPNDLYSVFRNLLSLIKLKDFVSLLRTFV